jgi:serine/threonine-protein kinase
MSPEQAKGKAVDKRADIFAFGAVLYECLTGKRAFEGEDVSDTLASILAREPDWEALPGATPSIIRSLLRRSVQKDPGDRLRDVGDARLEIKEYLAEPMAHTPVEAVQTLPAYPGRQRWLPWAGLIVGAIIASIAWNLTRETPPRIARFAIAPSQTAPLAITNNYPDVAISPDGMHIVYVAEDNGRWLYLRPVDELASGPIRGAGGGFPGSRSPFFSPDGREIGFVNDTNLKKVSINGGVPVTLCSVPSLLHGASWGTDGTIIFSTSEGKGLFRVPAAGGEPEIVTTPDAEQGEQSHRWPEILPGGQAVLFAVFTGEGPHIAVLNLETGDYRLLIPGGSHPHYSPTGHIVYGLDGALWAAGFDSSRLELTGDAVPVLEEVMTKATGAVNFALSKSGSLVYVPNIYGSGLQRNLVWVDREGREERLDAEPGSYRQPQISPDGERIAMTITGVDNSDVWIYHLTRKTLDRLTFDSAVDRSPQWSPDGQHIAFTSLREGVRSVSWKKADGTGAVERLLTSSYPISQLSFSPDQKTLVFVSGGGSSDIHIVSLQDEKIAETLLATTAREESPDISPDGNWIAYMSDESGLFEIYVRPYPDVEDGRWLISTEGGIHPVWSRDGHELFYFDPSSNEMMVVPLQTEPSFSHGNPRVLFEYDYFQGGIQIRGYDVFPDGQRFLMMKADAQTEATSTQLIFVENWFEELKRLAPAN